MHGRCVSHHPRVCRANRCPHARTGSRLRRVPLVRIPQIYRAHVDFVGIERIHGDPIIFDPIIFEAIIFRGVRSI
jgi:hypothetical protein